MTLRKSLFLGNLLVIGFLLAFFAITGTSYQSLDRFIAEDLDRQIKVGRLYERLGSHWMAISEFRRDTARTLKQGESLVPEAIIASFDAVLRDLDKLIADGESRRTFLEINGIATMYSKQLRDYDRLKARRKSIMFREVKKRTDMTESFAQKGQSLTFGFKQLLDDFTTALKHPDFQAAMGNTATLMVKISRVEKDLMIIQNEVTQYLTQDDSKRSGGTAETDKAELADRIQKRLQAVLGALDRSLEEGRAPVQTRVLTSIRSKIQDFRKSFIDLRDVFERPESDRLEIDDELSQVDEELVKMRENGVHLAMREAKTSWETIAKTSADLQLETRFDFRASFAFLLLALIIGVGALLVYPGKIANPLHNLYQQIRNFQLGGVVPQVPSVGMTEIDSLGEAFIDLAKRLNDQVGRNAQYMGVLKELGKRYEELHEPSFNRNNAESGLEKPTHAMLDSLRTNLPGIDIAKVMLIRSAFEKADAVKGRDVNAERNGEKSAGKRYSSRAISDGYYCLGEACYSETFLKHPEYVKYKATLGSDSIPPELPSASEFIPDNEGLSGNKWESTFPTSTSDSEDSWTRKVPLIEIGKDPTLTSRTYECGLMGSIHMVPIYDKMLSGEEEPIRFGWLFLYFSDPGTRLSQQDLSFIEIIGLQISFLIENFNLLAAYARQQRTEQQLALAQEIQKNLLPAGPPKIQGLHISCVSRPAFEVGGDYYDFFPLDDGRCGIVIADAAGKNVPAALIMTVFKTTLSTLKLRSNILTADEVLNRANEIICQNITNDRFITCMYVIIDPTTGAVEYACAGHPGIMKKGKNLIELTAPGVPLGISDALKYTAKKVRMDDGDLLLLYTDGVTEARNSDGEEFGSSGLKRFLEQCHKNDAVDDLLERLSEFVDDAEQHDDITAVAVKFSRKYA
ncbi:MAG: PP2C family protein-serine/threonine phosphatase [Candidatus Riflebacteria bacterium]|nr:PP2C family protein-serine/threonine phosphatase [Candidatus Riflebacteria bacterium]